MKIFKTLNEHLMALIGFAFFIMAIVMVVMKVLS